MQCRRFLSCFNPQFKPNLQELEVAKQEELDLLTHKIQSLQYAAACADMAHQQQMHAMQKQVAELRDIIDCSMHTKRASTLKLETAMNALNLSKPDAKRFVEVLPL